MLTSGRTQQRRKRILGTVFAGLLVVGACGGDDSGDDPDEETSNNDDEAPAAADLPEDTSWVATAKQDLTEVQVYDAPDGQVLGALPNPFRVDEVDASRATYTTFLVTAAEGTDPRGEDWLEVQTPEPVGDGTSGFIRTSDVDVTRHAYRITVDLDAFTLTLTSEGEQVVQVPVGLGRDDRSTSPGNYYTTQLIASTVEAYGPYAFGINSFPTDEGIIAEFGDDASVGIHGTNEPEAVGTAVSSGCIRLTNEDITQIVEGQQLPLGVPVDVVA